MTPEQKQQFCNDAAAVLAVRRRRVSEYLEAKPKPTRDMWMLLACEMSDALDALDRLAAEGIVPAKVAS